MKIIKNDGLIKRNARIGQWTSLGALGVLGVGMYLSFTRQDLFAYSIGALIIGFTMTQLGMYFSNRWGRSPRPDEQLDAGLKGLPADTAVYHYTAPAPHLLVGPMGVWVLLPYHQRGKLTFERNRWRLRGGGFMQSYMTIFGQEGLGRPDLEAANQCDAVKRYLATKMEESQVPVVSALLVFTSDQVDIEVSDAPVAVVPLKKLKDFMRQKTKETPSASASMQLVRECLPQG